MLLRTLASSLLFCAAAFTGFSAYGAEDDALKDVTVDDLKAKCKELLSDPQIKPVKVKLSCDDNSKFWHQGKQGKGKLKGGRKGGFSLSMKGFTVPRQTFDVPQQDMEIACDRYVEFEKNVQSIDVELSCSELLDIDDINSYCANLVDQRVQSDPELVEIKETGVVEYHCPNETM